MASPLSAGIALSLPEAAARHAHVLRLQPGDGVVLFSGNDDHEWPAEITRIGRREVEVRVAAPRAVQRELPWPVTLALAPPTNDRMDALVEKAGEFGAAAIQPLLCERSVLRLAGERAEARRQHWQGVAVAASEQCGRVRVTRVDSVRPVLAWLAEVNDAPAPAAAGGKTHRLLLSLAPSAVAPAAALAMPGAGDAIFLLSGPEGGLTADEEAAAVRFGWTPVGLGPRVLRADTAPLAVLAWLALRS